MIPSMLCYILVGTTTTRVFRDDNCMVDVSISVSIYAYCISGLQIRYSRSYSCSGFPMFIKVMGTAPCIRRDKRTKMPRISAVSWAIATLLVKRWGARFSTWVLTAYQMLFGGLLLLLLSLTLETPHLDFNAISIRAVLYLALLGSIVQFATWYYLLSKGDPGKTSAFLFLAPFFGILSGWLLLGEVIRSYVYIGGLFIFLGIFLVNWTGGKKDITPK